MKEWGMRELRFGEILDVSLQIVKNNFSSMLFISAIFWVPALTTQIIFQLTYSMTMNITMLFFTLVASFLSMSAIMLIVRAVRLENDWNLVEIWQQLRSRIWALFGASFLFGSSIIALALLIGILTVGFGDFSRLLRIDIDAWGNIGIMGLLVFLACISFLVFIMVRLGFYFPAVLFGEPAPAFSKSWRLTENNVWRLIGLYLVVSLIIFAIVAVPAAFLEYFSNSIILNTTLQTLLSIVTSIFMYAAMAVVYFDLEIRNEAGDLRALAAQYDDVSNEYQTGADNGVPPEEADQKADSEEAVLPEKDDHQTIPDNDVSQEKSG